MLKGIWCSLTLFEGTTVGGKDTPELTPQATKEAGEATSVASVAGEQEEKKGREQAFRELIEGEYKDLFTAYFQETFNRRFKEQKGMMEELSRVRTVFDAAAERFGSRDERELCAAIRAETEKRAPTEAATALPEEEGAPVASEEAAAGENEALSEAIARAVQAAVEKTREETERAVLESIRARGLRPSEGALTPGVGAYRGNGAAHLSRRDRAEMAMRSLRGERIEF